MPRISPQKRAAFDMLDCLFFNQTWLLRLSEDDETLLEGSPRACELVALHGIMQRVNDEVARTGATGIAAQALKHTIYCILEVGFSDDLVAKGRRSRTGRFNLTNEKGQSIVQQAEAIDPTLAADVHGYEQNFFMAFVAAFGHKAHGICTDTALTIAGAVGTAFSDAPTAARYRLTERILALEFIRAPLEFLSWMYRIGVLTSKKFAPGRVRHEISEDLKARVALLCEFTLMRDTMAGMRGKDTSRRKSIRRLQDELGDHLSEPAWQEFQEENDFYARLSRRKGRQVSMLTVDLARLEDNGYLHDVLERFADNHRRSRFWTGPQQSWAGVVGAGMLRLYHANVDPLRKITRNGNNHSKSDARTEPEETVAQLICRLLHDFGLVCRPGSLYETYLQSYLKKPDGLYPRATLYHALQQEFDVVYPAHVFDATYSGVVTTSTP